MNVTPQPRRSIRGLLLSLLFILALLMSLCCFMLLFAQLAFSGEKGEWLKASMTTNLRADYRPDEWVEMRRRFAPLRMEEVINEAAEEVDRRDENSALAPSEPVEPQVGSPQFVPVFIFYME